MNNAALTEHGNVAPAPIFSMNLIRELRGSPLTVLVAMILLEQSGQIPITAQLLKDITGYGDHTVTDSLRALESPTRQIVSRVSNGWRLAVGFQLPLEIQNREKCGFLSTTATTRLEERRTKERGIVAVETQNREKRGFSPEQIAVHKMLEDMRVGEPVCTELTWSNDEPLYVLAHCLKAAYENIETGLLIHRLRYRDVPEDKYRRMAEKAITKYISQF